MTDKPRLVDISDRHFTTQCCADVIEILTDALERAKAGKTVAIAVVEVRPDGATSQLWSRGENVNVTLGGVAILQHRMIRGTG